MKVVDLKNVLYSMARVRLYWVDDSQDPPAQELYVGEVCCIGSQYFNQSIVKMYLSAGYELRLEVEVEKPA